MALARVAEPNANAAVIAGQMQFRLIESPVAIEIAKARRITKRSKPRVGLTLNVIFRERGCFALRNNHRNER